MVDARVTCLVDAQAQVGEGPVWDPIDEVLWWTDINGRTMHRYDPRKMEDKVFDLGIRVGCFALREKGGFVLAAEHGFWLWSPGSNAERLFDVESDRPNNRMNDGGCDRQGRLFASSMNLESPRRATGACWRLSADLSVDKVADDLSIGNGVAFSPTGDRFFLADTAAGQVWAHPYDGGSGRIGARTLFTDFVGLAGAPDGATVDSDGGYWLAAVRGSRLYRFSPDGRLDRTIDLPISAPTRPMFGGSKLDRLYVTSIRVNGEALSGGLFAVDGLGCRGLPEPHFAG
jgi:sugar lactone lactonase YvrE